MRVDRNIERGGLIRVVHWAMVLAIVVTAGCGAQELDGAGGSGGAAGAGGLEFKGHVDAFVVGNTGAVASTPLWRFDQKLNGMTVNDWFADTAMPAIVWVWMMQSTSCLAPWMALWIT